MSGILGGIAKLVQSAAGVLGGGQDNNSLEQKVKDKFIPLWTDLKQSYIVYHQNCWETILFYVGQMWITLEDPRRMWVPSTTTDEWCPRPRINKFTPTIDGIVANFAHIPEIDVTPIPSDSFESIGICDVANRLVDHFIEDNALEAPKDGEEDKCGEAAQIFVLMGTVFTMVEPVEEPYGEQQPVNSSQKVYNSQCVNCDKYTPNLPEPPKMCANCGSTDPNVFRVEEGQQQAPQVDPTTGQPMMQQPVRHRACVSVGNPLYAFPRAGSKRLKGKKATPYMIWAERLPVEEIEQHWPELADADIEPDNEYPDQYNTTYENILAFYYEGYNTTTTQQKDSALVIEVEVEPGNMKDFPEGLYAVIINGKVQIAIPFGERYKHNTSRYSMAKYSSIPTMFWGRSVAFDIVPLQREKGDYESLIKLHGMTSAVDPIVADENTKVSEISGRADVIIWWKSIGPGSKEPHRMGHGQLDNGVYAQRDKIDTEFENIAGTVAVQRGEQPGSIVAASAIAKLQGQAEQMFNRPSTNWNNLWRETVRKGLLIYQKYMPIEEIIRVVGEDLQQQAMDFKNCDLDEVCRLISTTHGLPRTREELRQEMMALFDRGALDPNDVNVREKMYQLFGETGMLKQFNSDATRARMENRYMKEGKPSPSPMVGIEDLAVHFTIHSEQIKSMSFDSWSPEAKQQLIQHTMMTKLALEQAMQAMQAQAGPTTPSGQPKPNGPPKGGQGGPGGKGPGGGPLHPAENNPQGHNAQPTAGGITPAPGNNSGGPV